MVSVSPLGSKCQVLIRAAEERDIEAISILLIKTFTSAHGPTMPPSDLKTYIHTSLSLPAIRKDFMNPLMEFYIAFDVENNSQAMGIAQLTRGRAEPSIKNIGSTIELQRLYVNDNFLRRGVGGALVRHVEEVARERELESVWLGVYEGNSKAQKAYAQLGFERVGMKEFRVGESIRRDWVMQKTL